MPVDQEIYTDTISIIAISAIEHKCSASGSIMYGGGNTEDKVWVS